MKSFKRRITFLSLTLFLFMSTQVTFCQNLYESCKQEKNLAPDSQTNKDEKKLNKLSTTIIRTTLKSISETFWASLKDKYKDKGFIKIINDDEITGINLYDLGKAFSILGLDEFIRNENPAMAQRYLELLTPLCMSYLVRNIKKPLEPGKIFNLVLKLLEKVIMVKFFFKPKTTKHKLADALAFTIILIDFKKIFRDIIHDKCLTLKSEYLRPLHLMQQLTLDKIKSITNQIDLGSSMNKKHRKNVIAKTAITTGKPFLQFALYKILKPIIANSKIPQEV